MDNNSKQRIIDSYDCIDSAEVITPILCSVKCALETGAPDVWKPVVSGRLGFDFPSTENNILDWAELMYLECMLIKTNRE